MNIYFEDQFPWGTNFKTNFQNYYCTVFPMPLHCITVVYFLSAHLFTVEATKFISASLKIQLCTNILNDSKRNYNWLHFIHFVFQVLVLSASTFYRLRWAALPGSTCGCRIARYAEAGSCASVQFFIFLSIKIQHFCLI